MALRNLREVAYNRFGVHLRMGLWLKALGFLLFSIILSASIFPKKGLDFSDESHYLISADPAQMSDAWGWPYGWNLEKVFKYTNYSIPNFRIFRFVILILSTYIFAHYFLNLLESIWEEIFPKFTRIILLVIIICSSMFFYAGFLRTPSYNWLNLVGILFALSGVFGIQNLLYQQNFAVSIFLYPIIRICVGEFISLPAKPSTTAIIMIWILILTIIYRRLILGLYIFISQILLLATLIILAIKVNFWPNSMVTQTLQVLAMPPFASYHTLLGAVYDLLLTPINISRGFLKLYPWVPVFFFAHYLLLTKTTLKNSCVGKFYGSQLRNIGYSIGLLTFIWIGTAPTLSTRSIFWLENKLISSTFIFVLIFLLFALIMEERIKLKIRFSRQTLSKILPLAYVAISLVAGSIMFGFGSSGGISSKLSLAPIFLISIVLIVIMNPECRGKSYVLELILMAITIFIMVATIFFGSYYAPYRSASLDTMSENVTIGNHNSKIELSSRDAELISGMRSAAFREGFSSSTSLVNVVYPSGLGYGYALGGRQSPTIIFLWFGYENSLKQADFLLSKSDGRFDFKKSWIIKSSTSSYGEDVKTLEQFFESLRIHSGLMFPKDYFLVFQSSELELWKPRI